jgi:adenine-specific DNA-methyltransferase
MHEGPVVTRMDRVSSATPDYELTWANKHLLLDSDETGYQWIDRDDPRALIPWVLAEIRKVSGEDGSESAGSPNMAILGDALHALRALGDTNAAGTVRLCYIDPPFNTSQGYGQYPDSLRHSVWLSMVRDRLVALKPLLAPMGSVWVHLDDAEMHRARLVLDEVFGPDAFVATVVWQKRTTRESRAAFSNNHDYIHVYAPAGPRRWKTARNPLAARIDNLVNRDGDPRGPWRDAPFTAPGYRANQQYEIVNPAGMPLRPPKGRSWFATQDVFETLLRENRIWFPRDGAGSPRIKRFPEQLAGLVPFSIWGPHETGTNDDATRHLLDLFPDREAFATPKPEALLERVIHVASDPGDLVLDFFAGSGTTLSVAHKMKRRWIGVETSPDVFDDYLVPRLEAVVAGRDRGGITPAVGWLGGGAFRIVHVGLSSVGLDKRPLEESPKSVLSTELIESPEAASVGQG